MMLNLYHIDWDDQMEAAADAALQSVAESDLQRASQPEPPSAYPLEVLRYGDAGKALYDACVAALIAEDVPSDEARRDTLLGWDLAVKGAGLSLPAPSHP